MDERELVGGFIQGRRFSTWRELLSHVSPSLAARQPVVIEIPVGTGRKADQIVEVARQAASACRDIGATLSHASRANPALAATLLKLAVSDPARNPATEDELRRLARNLCTSVLANAAMQRLEQAQKQAEAIKAQEDAEDFARLWPTIELVLWLLYLLYLCLLFGYGRFLVEWFEPPSSSGHRTVRLKVR